MRVAIRLPGEPWEIKNIENTLTNLQEIIGGYIQVVPNLYTNAVMYCHEEGKLLGLPLNFAIYENDCDDDCIDEIVGPVIMFGPTDEDGRETDLTDELFEKTIKCMEMY